jgi:hypothetical protein
MGYLRCDAKITPPGMTECVTCVLEPDHTGLHYHAETWPDVHVAISWHSILPIPQVTVAKPEQASS